MSLRDSMLSDLEDMAVILRNHKVQVVIDVSMSDYLIGGTRYYGIYSAHAAARRALQAVGLPTPDLP